MKLLEQKFKTDNKDIFYNKEELKQHDLFMEKYVFPLDDEINKKGFNPNSGKYLLFFKAYEKLSPNVKENLKDIFLEYRVLYFKTKIINIINSNTFYKDKKNFDIYYSGLVKAEGLEVTEEFLKQLKNKNL